MSRFLVGDELGSIKSVRYTPGLLEDADNVKIKVMHQQKRDGEDKPVAVQALAIASESDEEKMPVAVAYSNGTACISLLDNDDTLNIVSQWKETRMKNNERYVGLFCTSKAVYSCTSNGGLCMTPFDSIEGTAKPPQLASLPTRLYDWRLSPSHDTFAYGGDEVDLSVWDTEMAFQAPSNKLDTSTGMGKKRKRNDALFQGEIWRAKNLPNDSLGLRQPVRICALTYLSTGSSGSHLLTGTQMGDVRRYDTRAARRPVSDWKGIGKIGGIKVVEKGPFEHEAFISDHGHNLFTIDTRNGRVIYGYKSLASTITSIAPSSTIMISTALDRFARIHSVFPPPIKAGERQDEKGEVLEKVYLNSVPSVVVWDQRTLAEDTTPNDKGTQNDNDVWDEMEHFVDGDEEDELHRKARRRNA
ncbi:hypothetical protein BDQ12DRAFT_676525 [Crucibulum laeve]|uniref:Ribosome biogenesis protein NSA1 n=1 Tax=Crucibulum laeve TaxID=68775 RepID=A0A5C3MB44_9AGAR|nr:hypothetical protein BDQ12DRAFT_676525 [Crucibulum laeve]